MFSPVSCSDAAFRAHLAATTPTVDALLRPLLKAGSTTRALAALNTCPASLLRAFLLAAVVDPRLNVAESFIAGLVLLDHDVLFDWLEALNGVGVLSRGACARAAVVLRGVFSRFAAVDHLPSLRDARTLMEMCVMLDISDVFSILSPFYSSIGVDLFRTESVNELVGCVSSTTFLAWLRAVPAGCASRSFSQVERATLLRRFLADASAPSRVFEELISPHLPFDVLFGAVQRVDRLDDADRVLASLLWSASSCDDHIASFGARRSVVERLLSFHSGRRFCDPLAGGADIVTRLASVKHALRLFRVVVSLLPSTSWSALSAVRAAIVADHAAALRVLLGSSNGRLVLNRDLDGLACGRVSASVRAILRACLSERRRATLRPRSGLRKRVQ